ncbi:ABC transporter substrate-binding protein [Oceanisphaera sp.]|uniref:ABC transporter substrate-binding protein n=1 Tax=Oceanisphaera sp. TaxID=1929979 RepID=UPI003A931910
MRLWLWGLLSSLLLTGCDNGNRQLAQESLLYCMAGGPLSFNPQLVMSIETLDATAHQLYDRLLDIDPATQQLAPGLASHWQRSDDGLRYRFTLREAISFHDTPWFSPSRPLTAEDVVFTFRRIIDKQHPYHEVGGGRYPFFDGVDWQGLVSEVRALDSHQVEFVLTRPNADFAGYLATDYAVILSAEYGEQLLATGTPGQLDRQPVGTGPFLLDSYRPDEFIRYYRHPNYWRGSAPLRQLIFDITPKSSKRLAKLLSGECDAMANPSASQLTVIERHPDLMLSEATGINVSVLALNTQKAPFDDIRVRRAFSLALQRDDILHAVYFNAGELAESLLPESSWGHDPQRFMPAANQARARWLLKLAGLNDGISMTLLMPAGARTYNPDGLKTGQLIQRRLAELGIKVTLKAMDEQLLRRELLTGEHDAVLSGWSADTPSPDNVLRNLLSCRAIADGSNASRWCHPRFEQLLALALIPSSPEERFAHYQRAQALVFQEMAVIPLVHSQRSLSYRSEVKGLQLLPYGGVAFHRAFKE